MAFPLAAVGAAGASGLMEIGGNIVSGIMGQMSADKAMDFAKNMYKHRYQWTMSDMEKAGLNPILAYQQGGGSTPSGSTATFPNPLAGAATSAKKVGMAAAEHQLLKSTSAKQDQETKTSAAVETTERFRAGTEAERMQNERLMREKIIADTLASTSSARQIEAMTENFRALTGKLGIESRLLERSEAGKQWEEEFNKSGIGGAIRWLDKAAGALSPFKGDLRR